MKIYFDVQGVLAWQKGELEKGEYKFVRRVGKGFSYFSKRVLQICRVG